VGSGLSDRSSFEYLTRPDGARLRYRDEGTGPMVLLVHGGTGTGDYDWEFVRPTLAGRFRVITPDLRGHGRSSDPEWKLSLESIAEDVLSLIESVGQRPASVVAFSISASAILRFACQRPDISDTFAFIGASTVGDPARVQSFIDGPWPAELVALEHEYAEDADHWRRLRVAMATSWGRDLALEDSDLARITAPTLVACGDRDVVEPVESAVALARALPAGELLVLPGAGHFVIRDRPAEFTVGLEGFLDRHLGS
jgi:pimeloyl-ACP methyl ester carboxylesterase